MSTTSHADSSIPTAQLPNAQVQPLNQNVEERILTFGRTILPSSPTSVTVNSFLSRNLKGSTHDRPCTSSRSTTECSCPHNTCSKFLYHTTPTKKECTSYIMQKKEGKQASISIASYLLGKRGVRLRIQRGQQDAWVVRGIMVSVRERRGRRCPWLECHT